MTAFLSTDELFCLIDSVRVLISLWRLVLTPKKKSLKQMTQAYFLDGLCFRCPRRPGPVAFRDYFKFSKHPRGLNIKLASTSHCFHIRGNGNFLVAVG